MLKNFYSVLALVGFAGANSSGGSGGGGTSVQADWDQSDATAADFVKNRTHYKTPSEFREIIPEMEIQDTTGEGVELDVSAFSGYEEFLNVTFDGVEYKCSLSFMDGWPVFGTGVPFAILFAPPLLVVIALSDTEPHTIRISGAEAIYTKMQSAYVANVFYTDYASFVASDAVSYLYSDSMCTNKITKADLGDALSTHLPIIIRGVSNGQHFFTSMPSFINCATFVTDSGYGEIVIWTNAVSTYLKSLYTAEYTAS